MAEIGTGLSDKVKIVSRSPGSTCAEMVKADAGKKPRAVRQGVKEKPGVLEEGQRREVFEGRDPEGSIQKNSREASVPKETKETIPANRAAVTPAEPQRARSLSELRGSTRQDYFSGQKKTAYQKGRAEKVQSSGTEKAAMGSRPENGTERRIARPRSAAPSTKEAQGKSASQSEAGTEVKAGSSRKVSVSEGSAEKAGKVSFRDSRTGKARLESFRGSRKVSLSEKSAKVVSLNHSMTSGKVSLETALPKTPQMNPGASAVSVPFRMSQSLAQSASNLLTKAAASFGQTLSVIVGRAFSGGTFAALLLAMLVLGGVFVHKQNTEVINYMYLLSLSDEEEAVTDTEVIKVSIRGDEKGAPLAEEYTNYALSFAGWLPYVWGGTSLVSGADCSGFIASILARYGLLDSSISAIHGYSSGEFRGLGTAVDPSEIRVGDVVCYKGHVAMYIGDGKVVHEPSVGKKCSIGDLNMAPIITVRRFVTYVESIKPIFNEDLVE